MIKLGAIMRISRICWKLNEIWTPSKVNLSFSAFALAIYKMSSSLTLTALNPTVWRRGCSAIESISFYSRGWTQKYSISIRVFKRGRLFFKSFESLVMCFALKLFNSRLSRTVIYFKWGTTSPIPSWRVSAFKWWRQRIFKINLVIGLSYSVRISFLTL